MTLQSWVEQALRREERMSDTFAVFTRKVLRVSKRYPSAAALIPSMHKRMKEVLSCKGGMAKLPDPPACSTVPCAPNLQNELRFVRG